MAYSSPEEDFPMKGNKPKRVTAHGIAELGILRALGNSFRMTRLRHVPAPTLFDNGGQINPFYPWCKEFAIPLCTSYFFMGGLV